MVPEGKYLVLILKIIFSWKAKGTCKWIPSWKKGDPSVCIGCYQICFERRNKENGRKGRKLIQENRPQETDGTVKWLSFFGGEGVFIELFFLSCHIWSLIHVPIGTQHYSPSIFLFLDIFTTLFSYYPINLVYIAFIYF